MLLVALWAALAHAGEAEDKLLAQRIIAGSRPEAVTACRLGLTLQPQPEWDTPLDGALRARCLNGAFRVCTENLIRIDYVTESLKRQRR